MDGRRHSLDIPISKALLALRRVRSLRDPSTHSMSKFSALVDNLNWDTNSTNGITLGFVNGCEMDCIGMTPLFGSKDLGLTGQRQENVRDLDLHNGFRKPNSNLALYENSTWVGDSGSVPIMSKQVVGSNHCGPNQEVVCETKSVSERCCNGYPEKGLDLTCVPPSAGYLEGVDSCNEPIEGSSRAERIDLNPSNRKTGHQRRIGSSRAAVGDIMSRVGSPCLSSHSTSLFGNEDVNAVDGNHHGCRITCCWSGTPRFSVSNIPSDLEDQPLLSGGVGETLISGEGKSWKHISNEISPSLESPQSFNQKFWPKSFCELVGQNVVARSLLTAISNARISSFYLFHGPRGTGKTSASRIFAAALNCLSLEEKKPCGLCRECVLFFSGRSRDVNEVDSVRINRKDRVRSLIKSASIPPVSSRFKIFIIDECHLLRGETWATFLNNLRNLSRHSVFLLITPDLNKLPQSAVSRSQKYHFPKIKDIDIGSRLGSICMKEGLQFEQDALDFVASKSNGSLRDAEMMLEQLSLLGKRITMSLVYELIGIVSDDELLDLLDLALSSDSSNTVRRARELMRSRIDPMQLISQLANLIMDVLAGKCQPGSSEVRRKFFSRYTTEASLQQLNHALKILSETEKQLRASNSQTTWLIVALLQLSSVGNSLSDAHDLRMCEKFVQPRDGDFCSESSPSESSKHLVPCACHNGESCKLGMQDGKETLESIWQKAIEICQSNSLKNILRKHGKLSSICFAQGLGVVELEFHHPDYVKKAEKSWKLIANALQSVLGCNVEMRINLMHCVPATKYTKKKISFSLFSCSRKLHHESTTENRSEPSCHSDSTSEKANVRDKYVETCSPYCGSQFSNNCCQKKEAMIRNNEGNALSIGMTGNCKCEAISAQEEEKQPGCLFRSLKLHKKMQSSETSQSTCLRFQPESNPELSIPRRSSIDTYCCTNSCQMNCSRDENGLREPCERCSYSLSLF
ncbi:protein STICHEL-like 2 isoform X1 [Rhododendron vialii]|uniref:protein STICHEL-like 2 isoform X1 n=1 Tax=Rhododendron vialii TaxID=182163 RepID=UPI00265F905C|nr:protein STICHEL-like 2 isoform X1 [Rhododendron vialii]XP_058195580.1 protein STICHEL-like 2 isoform X1 [Rhododendron vialii]